MRDKIVLPPAFTTLPNGKPLALRATVCATCQRHSHGPVSRRAMLQRCVIGAAAYLISNVGLRHALAGETGEQSNGKESVCQNCRGIGKVPCDLCSGTGFWRALGGSDPNLRYKGVVCPECEGLGQLTCPVCLGTGEGKIRGLLRRRKIEPGPGRVLQSN